MTFHHVMAQHHHCPARDVRSPISIHAKMMYEMLLLNNQLINQTIIKTMILLMHTKSKNGFFRKTINNAT